MRPSRLTALWKPLTYLTTGICVAPFVSFAPRVMTERNITEQMTESLLVLAIQWRSNIQFTQFVNKLVSALSPVNHKGLHQDWTQTSLYLQVIHFKSHHHTTSHAFWAYLYSAGTQHGNLHPAGWPILFCGPTQKPCVSHGQHREKSEEVSEKMQVNGLEV